MYQAHQEGNRQIENEQWVNKQETLTMKKPYVGRWRMQNDLTELRILLCYTGLFREAILKEVIEVSRTCVRKMWSCRVLRKKMQRPEDLWCTKGCWAQGEDGIHSVWSAGSYRVGNWHQYKGKVLRLLSRRAIESNLHFTSNYIETGVNRSQRGECFIINSVRVVV